VNFGQSRLSESSLHKAFTGTGRSLSMQLTLGKVCHPASISMISYHSNSWASYCITE